MTQTRLVEDIVGMFFLIYVFKQGFELGQQQWMALVAAQHTISLAESAAEMQHFSVILGDEGTIYSIIVCRIIPEVYHYLHGQTQNKYCNTLETMNGCL